MMTRRQYLAGSAAMLAASFARPAFALETVRQGYQTNIWGMPTYYLLKSGLLERHGVRFEEFAVPSGNLTMQQMVARQVDLGTYAGQSFIIGHEKGGLQEVRMDVNNMVAALAAKTVEAMVNVEPYNAIAVAEGIGVSIMDFSSVDKIPVFMAATPDFVDKNPDTVVAYLKAWKEALRPEFWAKANG